MKKKVLLIIMSGLIAISGNNVVAFAESESTDRAAQIREEIAKLEKELEELQKESEEETAEQIGEAEDVEILAEYTLPDSIGWYTRHYYVLKNNTNETIDISTSSLAYDTEGNMVAAADSSLYALGAGCTSVMYEAFETDASIANYETDFKYETSKYYESVIQDLSYVQNDIDGGAIFQITNNGTESAEFVEGYAMFFMGDQLIGCESTYFTDDDSEIKPGDTISEQITSYEPFDRMEFYMIGRRDN